MLYSQMQVQVSPSWSCNLLDYSFTVVDTLKPKYLLGLDFLVVVGYLLGGWVVCSAHRCKFIHSAATCKYLGYRAFKVGL